MARRLTQAPERRAALNRAQAAVRDQRGKATVSPELNTAIMEAEHVANGIILGQGYDSMSGGRMAGADLAVYDGTPPLPLPTMTMAARDHAREIMLASLELAEEVFAGHVALPSRAALDLVLMWLAHANAREQDDTGKPGQIIWTATPRLLFTSKDNQSGKSTALDLVSLMTGSRHGKLFPVTAPGFAALMSDFNETVTLDEASVLFGRGEAAKTLQGMILNGYTPRNGTFNARAGGTHKNLFGVVAYAGKDELITAAISSRVKDLLSRSVVIHMRRANRYYPDIEDEAVLQAEMIHEGMATWAHIMTPELKSASKALARQAAEMGELDPADVDNGVLRQTQIVRPLIACADVIGGDWPQRIRSAITRQSDLEALLGSMRTALAASRRRPVFTDEEE